MEKTLWGSKNFPYCKSYKLEAVVSSNITSLMKVVVQASFCPKHLKFTIHVGQISSDTDMKLGHQLHTSSLVYIYFNFF